jgi:16S rRNA (adenine1518-N6/adenine1519-N6)-dimethyltransferase
VPKKSLGQHFLSDPRILGRIADALPARAGDPVLEIGPGRGSLTRVLLDRGLRVVAIERDRELAAALRDSYPTLALIEGDALAVDWPGAIAGVAAAGGPPLARWFVIGNIPYNITSPLIDRALEAEPPPDAIVFLVQREVAARITATAGTAEYGALTVGVQAAAVAERLFSVAAGAFWPPPKVASAVIRLVPRPTAERPPDAARFRRLVVGLFGARRKQLGRALRVVLDVSADQAIALTRAAGLDPEQRAETVTVAGFRELDRVVGGD